MQVRSDICNARTGIWREKNVFFCLFQALGMPQEAIVCYQRALQVRPDYAMAYGEFLISIYLYDCPLLWTFVHFAV